MARSQDTFTKREREKQRKKLQDEKREKMRERKASGKKPGSMIAYLDENGNLSDTPPDPRKMKTFRQEDMEISVPKLADRKPDEPKKGTVSFFNMQKGFGFIHDDETRERVFVHVNDCSEPIQENDKVNYFVQQGNKGLMAVNVQLIK